MSENAFLTNLRQATESLGADVSALEHRQTQLEEQQRAMQAVIARTTDGVSESGDVTLTMTGAQQVVGVAIGGALSQRPSAQTIASEIRQAWKAATLESAESLRRAFADEFGIKVPGADADLAKLAADGTAEAKVHLDSLVKNELLGGMFAEILARAKEFEQAEFVGTAGCATMAVNGHNELTDATLDVVQVRELDNVTIGEDVLASIRSAQQQREKAQQALGDAAVPDELKPERQFARAQALIEGVNKRIAEGL